MHEEAELRRAGRVRRTTELLTYVAAAVFSLLGAWWALHLTDVDWRAPFTYFGDAVAVSAHVKTTLTTGWYEHQPLLGWPVGQNFHDFPTSDDLHLFLMKPLGAVLGDWALTLNVYYVLGFPLAALTATYFLRRVGVGRAMSVVGATLFALAPYHFYRGEAHLYLASYWVVPPALLVAVRVFRGEPLWSRGDGSGVRLGRVRVDLRAVSTTLAMVLVSAGAAYYGVFTLCLVAVGGVAALVQHRDARRFVGAVAAGAVTLATLVLLMVPDALYARANGVDTGALTRYQEGAEVYAIKLASLLLPVPGHVFGPFADLRATYDTGYPVPGEAPALGMVAAGGIVALLSVVVIQLARPTSSPGLPNLRWSVLVSLGGLALVALLFSTVGGVSTLVSFVTPNIRGWNRMSIFLALLALAAVGLTLDHLAGRLRSRTSRPVAMITLAAVGAGMIAVGTVDQVSPLYRPDSQAAAAAFRTDAEWVEQVEQAFGDDAAVFQLPYMSFPESPVVNGVWDTDQIKPFLHSDALRWSGGGIKGRAESDWPGVVGAMAPPDARDAMAAAGFSAVLLDTQALGEDEGGTQDAWRDLLGDPVVEGANGRFLVFDLRPRQAALLEDAGAEAVERAGTAAVQPTMLYPGQDVEVVRQGDVVVWTGPDGIDITVDNASATDAPVVITLSLVAPQEPVVVSAPWGDLTLEPGEEVEWDLSVPPGRSQVEIGDVGPVTITVPTVRMLTTPATILGTA